MQMGAGNTANLWKTERAFTESVQMHLIESGSII